MIARALTVVVSLLLTCAAAEIGIRMWESRVGASAIQYSAEQNATNLPQLNSLIQLVQKNQRGINVGVLYETNSFGIRGPERRVAKPLNVFRTVVIGDSFAMGSGVLYEDSFSAQLERALPEVSGRTHEVINLGISGLNLAESLNRYERLGVQFEPDLLIYAYTINDLEGDQYVKLMECNARREGHRASWSRLWRRIGENWLWIDEALFRPVGSYPYELEYNYFHYEPPWRAFDEQLGRLRRIATRDGVCPVVFIQTQLQALNGFHPYLPLYAKVAEAAAAHDLFVVKTFPYFRGKSPSSLWVAPFDVHPNAIGHGMLAKALMDGINGLPAHCRGASSQASD